MSEQRLSLKNILDGYLSFLAKLQTFGIFIAKGFVDLEDVSQL